MLCLSGFELYSRWVPLKRALSLRLFLLFPQYQQYYPEGLSVFAGLYKVGTEIKGLSSTNCNFQGLSRP